MQPFRIASFLFLGALGLTAQQSAPVPGFDPLALDKSVNPCLDFYQYACGGWLAANPVPADKASWGRFDALAEQNRAVLHQILETYSSPARSRTPSEQKIGDYYAACMDEKGIDERGLAPLKPELDGIAALPNKQAITEELVRLHRIGVNAFFSFGSEQDARNSTMMIAGVDQGGLGLPDRDYYLKTDAKTVDLRNKYREHVCAMFELLGHSKDQAEKEAETVMRIETVLAKYSLDRVSRRDPNKVYHKMTVHELVSLCPGITWEQYFAGAGARSVESLDVSVPPFFRGLEEAIVENSLDDLKTYLTWRLIHRSASLLPDAFVQESFQFYGETLAGAKELEPRWKRCTSMVDGQLGDALGEKFVEKTFGPDGKERTLKMVVALEQALQRDIETLDWMTPATKKQALVKLHAITNKIGYPDKWKDYSVVRITRDDALGNSQRAALYRWNRDVAKIGKPVDKSEWEMTPPTVDAYYNPQMNNINFPAGILQPPFFDKRADDAVNFGAIGAVIGHELTHGFDDEGRKFDASGNLTDWWTPADAKEFEQRSECLVKEYSGFTAVDSVNVNGELTLGENTADNGGLRIALMALRATLGGRQEPNVGGFTADQQFFLAWGQIWCENRTDQFARLLAQVDPHSPSRARVNGVVSNIEDFQKAFACKTGQPMVRYPACRVW